MNSKQKGGRGEREFATLCRVEGYGNAHRGQQFQGGIDSPDVKGLPGVHVEVKRVERLNILSTPMIKCKKTPNKKCSLMAAV